MPFDHVKTLLEERKEQLNILKGPLYKEYLPEGYEEHMEQEINEINILLKWIEHAEYQATVDDGFEG